MIVLDANVLIAHLDRDDAHHAAAEEVLVASVADRLGANTLTLAEVLVGPARASRLAVAQRALRTLEVEEVGFGAGSAARLAELRAETGLRLPDCCVLLAAEDVGGDLATFDDRLAAAAASLGLRPL